MFYSWSLNQINFVSWTELFYKDLAIKDNHVKLSNEHFNFLAWNHVKFTIKKLFNKIFILI